MVSNSQVKDWLLADTSRLPTNQLPLLRTMVGKRLVNIQRFIFGSLGEYEFQIDHQDFFRQGDGPMMFELEGIPPIYFKPYYSYHWDEKSIETSLESPGRGIVEGRDGYHPYTLYDREYVDEQLYQCIGQCVRRVRILFRLPEVFKDAPRALQGGIEVNFENGTTVIVSYYLNQATTRRMQLLYPEEIQWEIVRYTMDVTKGRIPWLYRFNRWKWRALDRLEQRLDQRRYGYR